MPATASKEVLKKFGVSRIEKTIAKSSNKTVDPFAVSGAFLTYCVNQAWLKKESCNYYITPKGKKELKKFGINL